MMYYREAYGIDSNVQVDAEVLGDRYLNGYQRLCISDKLDFPKQACSNLYNGR